MPISLGSLYDEFCGRYNTQQGGHVRPSRNFPQWVNNISIRKFNEKAKEAEKTSQLSDDLSPFLRSVFVVVTPVPGEIADLIKKPTDYTYFSAARAFLNKENKGCICKGFKVDQVIDGSTGEFLDEDDIEKLRIEEEANLTEVAIKKVPNANWAGLLNHRTLKPSLKKPGISIYEKGFKIVPKGIGVIRIDYYRNPVDATFLYTITNPGAIDEYYQFDAVNSTPLEWNENMKDEILSELGEMYGTYIREAFVYQTAGGK